jgi:hypothetical protein
VFPSPGCCPAEKPRRIGAWGFGSMALLAASGPLGRCNGGGRMNWCMGFWQDGAVGGLRLAWPAQRRRAGELVHGVLAGTRNPGSVATGCGARRSQQGVHADAGRYPQNARMGPRAAALARLCRVRRRGRCRDRPCRAQAHPCVQRPSACICVNPFLPGCPHGTVPSPKGRPWDVTGLLRGVTSSGREEAAAPTALGVPREPCQGTNTCSIPAVACRLYASFHPRPQPGSATPGRKAVITTRPPHSPRPRLPFAGRRPPASVLFPSAAAWRVSRLNGHEHGTTGPYPFLHARQRQSPGGIAMRPLIAASAVRGARPAPEPA